MINIFKYFKTKYEISEDVRELGEDIVKNYGEWKHNGHTISNGKISLWVSSNGADYLDTYPSSGVFTPKEKHYLSDCVKKSLIRKGLDTKKRNISKLIKKL